jgi:hypothetical protein
MPDGPLPSIASEAKQGIIVRRLSPRKQFRVLLTFWLALTLLSFVGCAKGDGEVGGWTALQPGMELWSEPGSGPHSEPVLALLYTLVPDTEYGIERPMPIPGLTGRPSLQLTAKATRVLYLAVVLLDTAGHEHKCATLLQPGEWRTLEFDVFQPAVADWSQITSMRFMDYTALLIGQGAVSLKVVGLPQ